MAKRKPASKKSSESTTSPSPERGPPPPKKTKAGGKIKVTVRGRWAVFKSTDKRFRFGSAFQQRKAKAKTDRGANNEARGRTSLIRGKLFFKDKHFPKWTRGEYHEGYRKQFLEEDARKGKFKHKPAEGKGPLDLTSFVPEQKNWGGAREQWRYFIDHVGRQIFSLPYRPGSYPNQYAEYGWWRLGDVVLLDQDNHPLRDIPGLNRTFSSEIEGWRIDALRKLYPQLKIGDIRGRMPSSRLVGKHQRPIQGFEAFTNRAWRWREAFGIADWNVRGGSSGRLRSGGENEEVDAVAAEEAAKALREESERARETQLYDILSKFNAQVSPRSREDSSLRPISPDFFTDALAAEQRALSDSNGRNTGGSEASMPTRRSSRMTAAQGRRPAAPAAPAGMRVLQRNNLDPETRRIFDAQRIREANRLGVDPSTLQLVPLFATPDDQHQALLQGQHLTDPWAVIEDRARGSRLTDDVFLIMRASNAPRGTDGHGNLAPNVAVLTPFQRQQLQQMAHDGDNYDWIED